MDLTWRWLAVGLVAAILALAVAGLGSAWREPPAVWAASGAGATTWYFAEGYTGAGFDEYLTILNPNAAGGASAHHLLPRPAARPVDQDARPSPANSRATVAVHDAAQGVGRGQEVGGQGREHQRRRHRRRAADVLHLHGAWRRHRRPQRHGRRRAPRPTWYFAEGYTGPGFDEYLTILNPNAARRR